MSDIKFIRRKGRIIPIKSKKKQGTAKVATGTAIGIVGASFASKDLKKSFAGFRQASKLEGLSRVPFNPESTISKRLKQSSKLKKLSSARMVRRSRTKFGLALGISSLVISSGVSDLLDQKSDFKDEIGNIAGTAASAGIVALTAKKFGLRAGSLDKLFSGFAKKGGALSRRASDRFAKTRFNKRRIRKGSQFEFDI